VEGGVTGGRRVDRDTVVVTIIVRLVAEILRAGGRERGDTVARQSGGGERGSGGLGGEEEGRELSLLGGQAGRELLLFEQ
jgi:hypothetical protein